MDDESTLAVEDPTGAGGASSEPTERARTGRERGRARVVRIGGPALPYDPTYHLLWRVDKIRAVLARERPDVLEIDSPYLAAAAALATPRAHFGIRTFCWHADFIDTYLRVMLERHVRPRSADTLLEPLWAMVRTIAGGCDATFVAGKWQVDKLRAHGVPRVVHMPFGVEKAIFRPEAKSAARRAELLAGGPEGAVLLIGVGRFAVEKRWDVVIDAFLRVRETRPAVLVLFGDGPERAAMEARAQGHADIRIAGFERGRERLASALASADALMHGCPFETFGFGVAEAMSAGLPVVVPDEGGAAESADDACAERYASGNADACAAATLRLLARDGAALRDGAMRARERIVSVRESFERLLAAYDDLLAERRGRDRRDRDAGKASSAAAW